MKKCLYYHESEDFYGRRRETCFGTREIDPCWCSGDERKCSYYEEIRERALTKDKENKEKTELKYYQDYIISRGLVLDYERWKKKHGYC